MLIQFLGRDEFFVIGPNASLEVIALLDKSNYSDLYTATLEYAECLNTFRSRASSAVYDIA